MADLEEIAKGLALLNALRPTVDNLGRMTRVDPQERKLDRETLELLREYNALERQELRNSGRTPHWGGVDQGWRPQRNSPMQFQSEAVATVVRPDGSQEQQMIVQGSDVAATVAQSPRQQGGGLFGGLFSPKPKSYRFESEFSAGNTAWLQTQLNERGFDVGSVDGKHGEKTQAGLDAFREANGFGHLKGQSVSAQEVKLMQDQNTLQQALDGASADGQLTRREIRQMAKLVDRGSNAAAVQPQSTAHYAQQNDGRPKGSRGGDR